MSNIVLIGMNGAGKREVAKRISSKMDKKVIDMALEVQKEEGRSAVEIISEDGAGYYRRLEIDYLERFQSKKNKILITDEDLPTDDELVQLMKRGGTIVFLQADLKVIFNRQSKEYGYDVSEEKGLFDALRSKIEVNEPHYLRTANVIIQAANKSFDEIADEIVAIL